MAELTEKAFLALLLPPNCRSPVPADGRYEKLSITATCRRSALCQVADSRSARPDPSGELTAPRAEPSGIDMVRSVLI
jgi:hypothetical protein